MKVRVIADGQPNGTRIMSEDGKNDLSNMITSVVFKHKATEPPMVELELSFIPIVFVNCVATKMLGPQGKEVRKIEYADGTVDEFPE
jgi:hypothetical protein